jgi:tetratricopeptide (TPR) repeat protein
MNAQQTSQLLRAERIVAQARPLGLRLFPSWRWTFKAAESQTDSALHLLPYLHLRFFRCGLSIYLALLAAGPCWAHGHTSPLGDGEPASSAEDVCRLGFEALRQKDPSAAEKWLNQCIDGKPRQLAPYLALCSLYQSQGRTRDLYEVALKGLENFPEEKRFYLTVGIQAGQEQRYEQAIEVFSEGYRRWPDDPVFKKNLANAHVLLGMKLLDESKDREAEAELRKATELAEDDVDAHLNLGRALHNLSEEVRALSEFDRVLALDPQTPLAHFHRGLVLYSLHDYDAAISELNQQIKSDPSYPPSFLFRGQAFMAKGEWDSALSDLDLAVTRMPDNAKAVLARAVCLNQLGKLKEAEADFRKAAELEPSNPGALNGLARVLSLTGREQEAETFFAKSRELSKNIRSASPGEIRFGSARSDAPH